MRQGQTDLFSIELRLALLRSELDHLPVLLHDLLRRTAATLPRICAPPRTLGGLRNAGLNPYWKEPSRAHMPHRSSNSVEFSVPDVPLKKKTQAHTQNPPV